MEIENIPQQEAYERECYNTARTHLEESETYEAFVYLIVEKEMTPDEIKAGAELVMMIESGEVD